MVRRLIILGSTGSIGTQALEVVAHLNALHAAGQSPIGFEVVGLAGGKNAGLLIEQARRFKVRHAALASGSMPASMDYPVLFSGPAAPEVLVRRVECDIVLAAMVGVAGLPATLAAVELKRDVALANKETLVAAGRLVVDAARKSGSKLLPVDSEHAAVWQCLGSERSGALGIRQPHPSPPPEGEGAGCPPMSVGAEIERVILTASGGPFRTWAKEKIDAATPEDALKHPTWNMGPKVTIDSASLMNKALEVIEAHWLFGLPGKKIGVLVHPQSIVHALVEYVDGSVVAQMAAPDMRGPIQHALEFPHRTRGIARRLDLAALRTLEFEEPDAERFPALPMAYEVIERGGAAGAVFNAANEEAVGAFLKGGKFGDIAALVRGALDALGGGAAASLDDIMRADDAARRWVRERLA